MNLKFITLLICVYLYYMFHHFKTTISFNHPYESILHTSLHQYFKHPIHSDKYENKICDFGKHSIFILIFYLLSTLYFQINKKISFILTMITFLLSLLNMNAVIYLIPFFIIELYKIIY